MGGRSIPAILGKVWEFPGIGPPPTFGFLMRGLRVIMELVRWPLSLLMYYNEHILRLKV